MSNSKCKLPPGSTKKSKKGYEEIHVPPPKSSPLASNEKLINISEMESWAQKAFKGAKSLNRIQSKVYNCAFSSDENMLICAPTGAGKVEIMLLYLPNNRQMLRCSLCLEKSESLWTKKPAL